MSIPTDHSGDPTGATHQQNSDRDDVRANLRDATRSLSPQQLGSLTARIAQIWAPFKSSVAQALSPHRQGPSPSAGPVAGPAPRAATPVPRRQPGAQGSQAKAVMYRAEPGEVMNSGSTWFEIPTTFREAQTDSTGNDYLISESGVGIWPLVLVGTNAEILSWLGEKSAAGIRNVLPDFDDTDNQNPTEIQMKVSESAGLKPVTAQSVQSLAPVGDATQSLAQTAVGMVGGAVAGEFGGGGLGSVVANFGSAIGDLADAVATTLTGTGDRPDRGEPVYMVEFGLGVKDGQQVANRIANKVERVSDANTISAETRITFGELRPLVEEKLNEFGCQR